MPHKCTKCGKVYPDGDKRILKGCECGNNKFIYVPKKKREIKEVELKEEKHSEFEREKERRKEEKEIGRGVESVKIISPGMYEINLEKVFSRKEIVIALQEDGKYAIHLPSLVEKLESKRKAKGRR